VKPLDFPLLADENIAFEVVTALRQAGSDVTTVVEAGLLGRPDAEVLRLAVGERRVVLTHDLAFGRAEIRAGSEFVGIISLRPGHISTAFVLSEVDALAQSALDLAPPFIAVVERRGSAIRIRVRTDPPW
jgi:predicted nuclease of predicted toxin-antitoxin system